MKLTIGVMGSSGGDLSEEARRKAYQVGEAIAEHGAILITGGCPGLPYEVVKGAKARGGSSSASRPDFPSTSTAQSMPPRPRGSTC